VVLWDKTYGVSTGYEEAHSVIPVSDGYLLAGYTTSFGDPNGDAYLIKVNKYVPTAVSTLNMYYDKVSLPEGRMVFQIRVNRSDYLGTTCSVTYATSDGTAFAGKDYYAASDTVTFQPGQTMVVIPVRMIDDPYNEPAQFFYIKLTSSTSANIGKDNTVCEIRASDPLGPPEV